MSHQTYTEDLTLEDVLHRLTQSYRVTVIDRCTFEIKRGDCSDSWALLYFARFKPEYGDGEWSYAVWFSGDEPDWQPSGTLSDALEDIAEERPRLKETKRKDQ